MSKPKWKPDTFVKIKGTKDCKFHITETIVQKCPANIEQIWYTGRLYSVWAVDKMLTKFHECELEDLKETKND